jgi:hypothetical protein
MEKIYSKLQHYLPSESTILTFITAMLYFCAVLSFAYLFTMS